MHLGRGNRCHCFPKLFHKMGPWMCTSYQSHRFRSQLILQHYFVSALLFVVLNLTVTYLLKFRTLSSRGILTECSSCDFWSDCLT